MDYKGIKCPVCEKPFTEEDDVVVCPICGAPYHRHCYIEKGDCIFTELHESGSTWSPPEAPTAPNVSSEIKDKECPNCGVLNAHSAMFCNICGSSLTGDPHQHRNTAHTDRHRPNMNDNYSAPFTPMGSAFHGFGGMPFMADPMGGVNPAEQIAEDVTYGDVSKVVQQNTGYYMSVFRRINAFRRSKFNFTAFLFSGGWLMYRKQYKSGILVTVLMFLLYIAQTLCSNFGTYSVMMNALDTAGLTNSADLSYIQISNVTSQYLLEHPSESLLFFSPLICTALMLITMLIVGINANKWYMQHCIRVARKIKAEGGTEEVVNEAYLSRGGCNIAVTFCLMACYMVLQWIPAFFV